MKGFRHGYGRLTVTDSSVMYEGQWQSGKRHGRGILYYNTERTAYYEGVWHCTAQYVQLSSLE